MPQVCLPTSKHYPNGPRQASKMWRGPDHDYSLLAGLEFVPRDHAPGSRATKKVQTITVTPVECHKESNSKGHEKHPAGYLEADITIYVQSAIREEIARKVTDSWTRGAKQNYQRMFEQWCCFCNIRDYQSLKFV